MPGSNSGADPTLPAIESLFDLLYVDGRRIATYIAQLDPNGTLTGIKSTFSGTTTLNAQGKLSAVVASGSIQGTDAATEGTERQFDPLWVMPITLMNRLDELGFIHRGLSGASIGSLVLIRGICRLVDVATVKEMWPFIGRLLAVQAASETAPPPQGSRRERRARDRSRGATSPTEAPSATAIAALADMAQNLPHALEAHMLTTEGVAWATLNRDGMLTNSQDIALKHGSGLPGEWHMLAILDGMVGDQMEDIWEQLPTTEFAAAILQLLGSIREVMGRPAGYFGVTPLVLFRTVGRASAGM